MACVESTTTVLQAGEVAAFLSGFVAAEGSFNRTGNRFRFAIALGASDASMCKLFAEVLGVGYVVSVPRRQPHFDDETIFAVQGLRDLLDRVVPFMDAHLPPSKKRNQFLEWKRELIHYWEHDARRRRPCSVEGCSRTRRAKGLCRHHYYKYFGC